LVGEEIYNKFLQIFSLNETRFRIYVVIGTKQKILDHQK